MTRKTLRRLCALVFMALTLGLLTTPPALAHGERSQEAFLRMQTIGWLDTNFSSTSVQQGQTFTITGTAKLMDQWPNSLAAGDPKIGYIGVIAPGPVVIVKERTVNGVSAPGRIEISKGSYYQYSLTLVGRRVGRWHIHPSFAVKGAGTVLGPGQWINVTENPQGFRNEATLYNGDRVNLENYGLPLVWGWQVVTVLIGLAWMLWWTVPKFHRTVTNLAVTSQIPLNDDGVAVGLNSKRDHRVVNWFVLVTLALMAAMWIYQAAAYPVKIPQQVVQFAPPTPTDAPADTVSARTGKAVFDPAADKLTIQLQATNNGERAVQVSEFSTSTLDFKNQAVTGGQVDRTLDVQPAEPIAPGETKQITISMVEGVFQSEKLIPVGEAQLTAAGILVFQDDQGQKSTAEINAPIQPNF